MSAAWPGRESNAVIGGKPSHVAWPELIEAGAEACGPPVADVRSRCEATMPVVIMAGHLGGVGADVTRSLPSAVDAR